MLRVPRLLPALRTCLNGMAGILCARLGSSVYRRPLQHEHELIFTFVFLNDQGISCRKI